MTDQNAQPQDTTPEGEFRPERDSEPNDLGFAGEPATPEPEPSTGQGFGEAVAVPAGDLTGAITAAIEEATDSGETDRSETDKS